MQIYRLNNVKICLAFVFNHQYLKNIPKLKNVVIGFPTSIPFSTFLKVLKSLPVYETSIHFQGFFAQAYSHLPKDLVLYFLLNDLILYN